MADLKEEPTVENNDINQAEPAAPKKAIDPSLEGVQFFYEKNKKAITYIGGGLAILIAALCYYKLYYMPEKEGEAANEIFWAQSYFERDSFNLALKGGVRVMAPEGPKQMLGFEQVAEEYSMTKSGNLANFCAGICLLRTGKYEQGIEFLQKYDGDDKVVAPLALGAIGDCHLELNQLDDAVKYYLKASEKGHNSFTTPHFLKKAGFAYEQQANYSKALETYERIKKEFPSSNEGKEADRSIAKVKALGNI